MGGLVGGDPVLALERQRDVVEAVHEHVPRERVELEREREGPTGCADLERLEVDRQLVLGRDARP